MKLPSQNRRRRVAFTLMEVLVVVAILVVLAGIGIGVFYYLDTAKERVAKTQVKNLEVAVESFKLLNERYPDSLEELTESRDGKAAPVSVENLIDPWGRQYVIDTSTINPRTGKILIYSQGPAPGTSPPIRNWNQ